MNGLVLGQSDPRVRYQARGRGYTLFLTEAEAVLVLRRPGRNGPGKEALYRGAAAPGAPRRGTGAPGTVAPGAVAPGAVDQGAVVRMRLEGAHPAPKVSDQAPLPCRVNYFIGNDPAKWRTNIPTYAAVRYEGVYPGVDLVYYGNQRTLEYDFVVAPGADPGVIALRFEGAEQVELDAQGDLVLHVAGGTLRQRKPVVYQEVEGQRRPIEGRYVLRGRDRASFRVGFTVGAYDTRRPLIIDPELTYSTYLGGSFGENGFDIAIDAAGNAYVTGDTLSTDFPIKASSAFDSMFSHPNEAFVTKLNGDGSGLAFSSYLGGSSVDYGTAIALGPAGSAYAGHVFVTGYTGSADFPTRGNPFPFDSTIGDIDAFVVRIGPSETVGLHRPNPTFFLRDGHGGGPADATFSYGPNAGWLPVTGAGTAMAQTPSDCTIRRRARSS